MATTAFGVRQDANRQGTDDLTLRKIIAGKWNNTGVVSGLATGGTSGLKYQVNAGVAVLSMGDADGKMEAYWPGGQTENAVSAGNGSYARIDTVYLLSRTGNPDNKVHAMVAQGTPSANPAAPGLPVGAVKLRSFKVPASATSTSAAVAVSNDMDYAIPYGASMGLIAQNWDQRSYNGGYGDDKAVFYENAVSFTLPTDRLLMFRFENNFSAGDGQSSEQGCTFQVDNADLKGSSTNFVASGTAWTHHEHTWFAPVTAGYHTARMVKWWQHGSYPVYHYGANGSGSGHGTWVGQRLQVFDFGVSR